MIKGLAVDYKPSKISIKNRILGIEFIVDDSVLSLSKIIKLKTVIYSYCAFWVWY